MPSTVVHLALAGLLAACLLGEAFDRRAVAVVLLVTIVPDLDVFASLLVPGTHRAALHSLLIPAVVGGALYYDTRVRDRSAALDRWGRRGVRVAWVSVAAYAVAGIGLDLVTGGANPLYPLHDQFYRVNGEFIVSSRRGLVQTFVEIGGGVQPKAMGSTGEVHVGSGVDPNRGKEPANVDRIFPVVQSGWQLLLVVTSVFVLGTRFREQ